MDLIHYTQSSHFLILNVCKASSQILTDGIKRNITWITDQKEESVKILSSAIYTRVLLTHFLYSSLSLIIKVIENDKTSPGEFHTHTTDTHIFIYLFIFLCECGTTSLTLGEVYRLGV
jgi:hypothetical protein